MTLIELKEIVDRHVESGRGDLDVVIPDNSNSFGQIGHTPVKSCSAGFDFNTGLFLVFPEKPLRRL